ncbi:nuclear transport factor 2 family protein [Cryptosporangium aurantiacum]|uniref:SnoaL-like domain-containing protein n=1 Tax=Cryptosporangium aurantiacum TaxID=134849 RepID=A0A1M7R3V9_9ACTN|nr:nuclear transport factor 2 family protein [Cryptosporangium aurantiacum]SHN39735.1 SnoaL-like domain-containing protein [Cryptosporangium aurantiacum]
MVDPYTQNLLDEFACRRLIEKYWWTESRRDAAGLTALFTEDGRWGAAVGRDAITAQADGFFAMMRPIAENPTSFGGVNIEVDGDEAAGFVHGIAHLVLPQSDGATKVVVVDATYDVRFRREQGEWRISSLVGPGDPNIPHGASFQFEARGTAIDFGMPAESEHNAGDVVAG